MGPIKVEYVDAPVETPAGMEGILSRFMGVAELLAPRPKAPEGDARNVVVAPAEAVADKSDVAAAKLKAKWNQQVSND